MPRVTYAHRLSALAAKPLSDYDKGFVESLMQYYQRKRSMTAGRRAAIERLEERYSDESLAAAAANPLNERLATLADRVDPGTWDAGFVESVYFTSSTRGRDSVTINSWRLFLRLKPAGPTRLVPAANTWKQTYLDSDEMQQNAHIVATYYSITGYYAVVLLITFFTPRALFPPRNNTKALPTTSSPRRSLRLGMPIPSILSVLMLLSATLRLVWSVVKLRMFPVSF